MPALDTSCRDWQKFKITAPSWVSIDDDLVHALRTTVMQLHAQVPVDRITVEAETFPATYEIRLLDGRRWTQTFSERSVDPGMTFTVTDTWKLSEFGYHRDVRNIVLRLLVEQQVTNIDVRPR